MPQLRLYLEQAKKFNPKLWLIYKTEANVASFDTPAVEGESFEVSQAKEAVRIARYAVKLAPHLSYTHEDLGYFLVNLENAQKEPPKASVVEYKKAQTLLPVNCDASLLLINVHRYEQPNVAERQKAEKAVLATIPPHTLLSSRLKKFLTKQGITPPKS